MSGTPHPIQRLEDVLLEQDCPDVRVIDLGWGPIRRHDGMAQAYMQLVRSCDVEYQRPRAGSCDTIPKLLSVAKSYIKNLQGSGRLVLLLARVTRDWRERAAAVNDLADDLDDVDSLCLTPAGSTDCVVAVGELAALLAGEPDATAEVESASNRALGEDVIRNAGVKAPLVVIVCGQPERQGRAAAAFPEKVREEFGLDGEWVFTDYKRPERVVGELERICERSIDETGRTRLVAVVFSQTRNASDAKHRGMKLLRDKGVLCVPFAVRSLGSALRGTEAALQMYVGQQPSL